jgi:hypothetical protein
VCAGFGFRIGAHEFGFLAFETDGVIDLDLDGCLGGAIGDEETDGEIVEEVKKSQGQDCGFQDGQGSMHR